MTLEGTQALLLDADQKTVAQVGGKTPALAVPLLDGTDAGTTYTIVRENAGAHYTLTYGAVRLEEMTYYFLIAADINDVFSMRTRQLETAGIAGAGISAGAAVLLLTISVALTRPLRRMNAATRAIARGEYHRRVRETGSAEFTALAQNMNAMAQAVEETVLALEKTAEDRKIFIANFAHEMKTPLTSIMGFADILRVKKKVSEKELREYAGIIVDETKRLRSLSSKLMELIAVGNTAVKLVPMNLRALLVDIGNALTPILTAGELTLVCQSQDCDILTDAELFKSLIFNLVDNAIKASPPGGEIRITCEAVGARVLVTVADNGIGMKQEDVKRADEPFYMADKSRTRKAGGAGLGLALCKEIAKLHGGTLEIESTPDKGTRVRFSAQTTQSTGGEEDNR
ncbi:MAG: HAMP domain-containing sensor histidine kinase [Oscillospiraceae bacterium]